MPYRRAHLAVWALLGLTLLAFWPGYFRRLGTSAWQHHFHASTAVAWMLLLIGQSMLIDRRDRARHRWLGRAMLGLVPLFCASGFLVVQTMERRTDVFRATMGDRLMWADGFSTMVFAYLCYKALVHRRNAALHGGYLLATPLPLIMAVVTRLPLPLVASGTPLPEAFHPGFNLSMLITLGCVAALWRWQPRQPAPFIAVGVATLLEWAGYHLAPALPRWADVGIQVAAAPTWLVGGIGFAIGATAVGLGWQYGRPSPQTVRTSEAAFARR
jgi:hypothetical protein